MNATTVRLEEAVNKTNHGVALDMLYVVLVYTLLKDKGFRFNNPCVGVLLGPNLVLTTLSCIEVSAHGVVDTEVMLVYVRNSQVLKTERIYVHPNMNDGPNVALLLCETALVKDFPKLPEKEFKISDFEYCKLCGFGSEENLLKLEAFNAMRINRSDMEVCNSFGKGQTWVCLHFTDAMPCRGDVGAPLICDGALHAIYNPSVAHWAPPDCHDIYGATFTPLYSLVPWIRQVNSSFQVPVFRMLNTPWCWIGTGVTALTIIVVIYYALMRYVDWKCSRDEAELALQESGSNPRVIYVKSSQMSRITSRWLCAETKINS